MGRKRVQMSPSEYAVVEAHMAEAEKKMAQLERELVQLRAIERLEQIRTGAIDFVYDVTNNTMRYRLPGQDETMEFPSFIPLLKEWNADNHGAAERIEKIFSPGGPRSGSIEVTMNLFKTGELPHRLVYQRIEDSTGVTVVGFAEDISDEAAARDRLRNDAERDELTGLYTKETLLQLIEFELGALAPGEKGVIFYFDMDAFGAFNTEHGKTAGDSFLRAVASALKNEFRGVDLLARVGADEFAVFFRGFLAIDVIERRAQHLLDTVRQLQTELTEAASCSMGISVTGSPREDCEKLLENAGTALKLVKNHGGNRYRMFDNDRY